MTSCNSCCQSSGGSSSRPPVDCNDCRAFLQNSRPVDNPWSSQYQVVNGDGSLKPSTNILDSRPSRLFDDAGNPIPTPRSGCPPCEPAKKKAKPLGLAPPKPGALFDDIGLPEKEFGILPVSESICPTPDVIERNDEYEDEAEVWFSKPPPEPVQGAQYTPEYTLYSTSAPTMMNNLTALSQAVGSVTNQGPDGNWMNWTGTEWDGNPIDPTTYTTSALCSWLRPTGSPYVIRGIRELFFQVNPFADLTAPTVAEINNWNVEVIRHFRNMFGNTTPISWNARLALEARWATERKRTTVWDAKYPGTFGSAYGPCGVGDGNPHCGESFFPDATDRAAHIAAAPYNNDFVTYPELSPYDNRYSQASGISGTNADLPWSIKLSVIIASWICGEGLTGHPGPFVNPTTAREEVGMDWWWESGSSVAFRVKWR